MVEWSSGRLGGRGRVGDGGAGRGKGGGGGWGVDGAYVAYNHLRVGE